MRWFFVLTVLILIVLGVVGFSFNRDIGWHPLQQIVTDSTGSQSVDSDSNGIIDHTDADLQEITNNGASTTRRIIVGGLESLGQTNIMGNVGIGTTNPQAKLDVNGDVLIRATLTTEDKIIIKNGNGLDAEGTIYTSGDVKSDGTVYIKKLCLYNTNTGNYECINKWDDLLNIIFATVP